MGHQLAPVTETWGAGLSLAIACLAGWPASFMSPHLGKRPKLPCYLLPVSNRRLHAVFTDLRNPGGLYPRPGAALSFLPGQGGFSVLLWAWRRTAFSFSE